MKEAKIPGFSLACMHVHWKLDHAVYFNHCWCPQGEINKESARAGEFHIKQQGKDGRLQRKCHSEVGWPKPAEIMLPEV